MAKRYSRFGKTGGVPTKITILAILATGVHGTALESGRGSGTSLEETVPPRHWSYVTLERFAKMGLLKSFPAFQFRGGRIFTRGEMARLVGEVLGVIRAEHRKPSADVLQALRELREELEFELKALGLAKELKQLLKGVAPKELTTTHGLAIQVKVSNILRLSFREGAQNDTYSDRLTLESASRHFRLYGEMELNNDEEGTFVEKFNDFYQSMGSEATFHLTRRYAELFGETSKDRLYVLLRVGDSRNVSTGKGLVVGALDVDGARLLARYQRQLALTSFWGRTDRGDTVTGQQLKFQPKTWLQFGGTYVSSEGNTGLTDPTLDNELWGVDFRIGKVDLSVEGEFADKQQGGQGLYATGSALLFDRSLKLELERRDYRDFAYDFNNPPIYTGISGADLADEDGWRASVTVGFLRGLPLKLVYDRSQNQDGSDLKENYLGEISYRWRGSSGSLDLGASGEFENKATADVRASTLWAGYRWMGGQSLRAELSKREEEGLEDIDTVRIWVERPLFAKKLRLRFSNTLRNDAGGTSNNIQIGADWQVSESNTISSRLSTTITGGETENTFDFTWVWRF